MGEVASHYSPFVGLDEDEATSILSLELVEGAHDYLVMWHSGNRGIIVSRFRQILRMHARADRIRRLAEDCENRYSPEYVKLFLPFYFDRADWASGPADGNGSKPGWRTGDAIDTALDISLAWPRLKPWQKALIVSRHATAKVDGLGEVDWQAVAEECGYANPDSAQRSYREAVYQLSVEMTHNRRQRSQEHQGPGSRRAVSNAAANAAVSHNN